MTKIDRLLIGALVLGVWALVATQFFGGMTASAATQDGTIIRPMYVRVLGVAQVQVNGEAQVHCNNCN